MQAFVPIDPDHAAGKAASLLAAVKQKMGVVPNMTRHMAQSPAVLEAYLGMSGALAGGGLSASLRQQLALLTAESNRCEYCLAAHSYIGKAVGLPADAIAAARAGRGTDARSEAALVFAQALLANRGNVTDAQVLALRAADFDDGAIGEVIAHVALNVFTNYFNKVVQPVVDFPAVPAPLARAA